MGDLLTIKGVLSLLTVGGFLALTTLAMLHPTTEAVALVGGVGVLAGAIVHDIFDDPPKDGGQP